MVRQGPAKPLSPVRIWVPPLLYLIATPIGNLGDFSHRALEVISSCDYLLCEDTRRTRILLKHYEISKPLKSFHLHNERGKAKPVLDDLKRGKTIGLVSDAGTPTISDPGYRLVAACYEEELDVCPIPGASAPLAALSASGLPTDRFQFVGFLPRKKGKLTRLFEEALAYPGTTICFESPFRVGKALTLLAEIDPDCMVVVAREITKKFETFYRGRAEELATLWVETPPKGEIVILIAKKG